MHASPAEDMSDRGRQVQVVIVIQDFNQSAPNVSVASILFRNSRRQRTRPCVVQGMPLTQRVIPGNLRFPTVLANVRRGVFQDIRKSSLPRGFALVLHVSRLPPACVHPVHIS